MRELAIQEPRPPSPQSQHPAEALEADQLITGGYGSIQVTSNEPNADSLSDQGHIHADTQTAMNAAKQSSEGFRSENEIDHNHSRMRQIRGWGGFETASNVHTYISNRVAVTAASEAELEDALLEEITGALSDAHVVDQRLDMRTDSAMHFAAVGRFMLEM